MTKPPYLASSALPLPHGFFTREGGVSQPPFDSLNVKQVGDDPAHVAENRRRACAALDLDADRLVFLRLVHDTKVLVAGEAEAGKDHDGYDAAITQTTSLPLAISVADCFPILFHDPEHQAIGIAHAGWRGTVGRVGPATLAVMREQYGTDPAKVTAVIGPGIGVESYEVGDEVAEQFDERFKTRAGDRWHLDLLAANRAQLDEAGVGKTDVVAGDTYQDRRFFSHRRDGETGRQLAVISLP